jgi:hypothetical protein
MPAFTFRDSSCAMRRWWMLRTCSSRARWAARRASTEVANCLSRSSSMSSRTLSCSASSSERRNCMLRNDALLGQGLLGLRLQARALVLRSRHRVCGPLVELLRAQVELGIDELRLGRLERIARLLSLLREVGVG